ncbi:7701_t:CDS:1, partial [Funneliformis caledonium]
MGVAWLQTDPLALLLSFNASLISSQPSSSLAELVAILSAIYVAPINAT